MNKATIFDLATKLTPEIVSEIMELSELRSATSQALFRASNPTKLKYGGFRASDWLAAQEAAPNCPERNLIGYLKTLTHEQTVQLIALVWLGRGDGHGGMTVRKSFARLCKDAKKRWNPDDADYILHKPLKRYLQAALQLKPSDVLVDEVALELELGL